MYCIYKITNLINGKTYIGQHKYKDLNDNYMGSGKLLKLAQKKYGLQNFKKEILVFSIVRKDFIDLLEKEYIAFERLNNKNGCYNISDGGEGGDTHNHHVTVESRRKQSLALKGRISPTKGLHWYNNGKVNVLVAECPEGFVKGSLQKRKAAWNKGLKMSEKHCKRMSEIGKGRPKSEEWKRKMSERMKGNKNAKGCVRSEETRKKLSEAKRRNQLNKQKGKSND